MKKLKELFPVDTEEAYLNTMITVINKKKSKSYLLLYEYFNTTDICHLNFKDIDIEHIIPESTIKKNV